MDKMESYKRPAQIGGFYVYDGFEHNGYMFHWTYLPHYFPAQSADQGKWVAAQVRKDSETLKQSHPIKYFFKHLLKF